MRHPAPKQFINYQNDCFKTLDGSLCDYKGCDDNDALYKGRVSIKKIRTCISCLESYFGADHFKETKKALKKIFRSGGKLREFKLYEEWFRKNHLTRLAKAIQLDVLVNKEGDDYLLHKNRMEERVKNGQKIMLRFSKQLQQQDVFDFYVKLIRDALPFIIGRPSKEHWHIMRKKIKRILYARHWQDEEGLKLISDRQAKFLDDWQHEIGFWHDNEVRIEWINQHAAENNLYEDPVIAPLLKKTNDLLDSLGNKLTQKISERQEKAIHVFQPLTRRLDRL